MGSALQCAVILLLTPSAELRNAIYPYCRPERHEILRHVPQGTSEFSSKNLYEREFPALSHVNRKIRKEFLPVYMDDFGHRINILDGPAYVRSFPALPPSVTGTIAIDVDDMANVAGIDSVDVPAAV